MSSRIHHVHGRLRIKSPVLKRNQAQAEAVRALLQWQQGVLKHEINPLTGSVLIHYDARLTSVDQIVDCFRQAGYITSEEGSCPIQPERALTYDVANLSKATTNAVVNAIVDKLMERSMTALISAIL